MRILYLAPDPVPGPKGASVRIARTVHTLLQLGHEVELFTPATATGERLHDLPHETVELAEENFLDRMLSFRRAAGAWLAERDAELVQLRSIWEGVAALAWARTRGARVVLEAHGFPSIELPFHFPALHRAEALLEKLIYEENRILAEADRVITPSRTGARYLQARGVAPERIGVVPNCVDPELFSPGPEPPPDGPPLRIVYQGTMAPWQGLETLLEALTRFRGRALELHVVGPSRSAWRRSLREFARRCRVHHHLHLSRAAAQPDLVPVLRTAHVCVAPLPADARNAVQGCCPIKLLEYMAVGRPILATAISPVEELLEHQRNGWLCRPSSPASLADALGWMLSHPEQREALGRQAREDVVARFGPERFAGDLGRALDSLLD